MKQYSTFALIALALAAACARPLPPAAAPAPSPRASAAPMAAAPVRPILRDTAPTMVQQAAPAAPAPDTVSISSIEVTKRAAEVFGDTAIATPVAAPAPDSSAEPSWDIDVHSYETTARVEHYVRVFSGRAKEHIEAQLARGSRYESMIRTKLREGGLPEDMYYLAMIESGFDPNAYSRAAAVGMWQFMTSTAKDMGLRVDWWVDERRDPVRSTGAAVRFIKGLKEQFGSLYLAAAAYNGGPNRIARGLTRYADDFEGTTGDDLFFALVEKNVLRNETSEYVPQLIAAALIGKEPQRYGVELKAAAPYVYDSVRVGPGTPLAAIARAAGEGVSVAQIQELNPQILRGVTPPKDSLFVRIPDGAAERFSANLAELPKSTRVGLFTVVSKKGETMESIAKREGIAARQLVLFNPKAKRAKSGRLVIGQTLIVPTPAVAGAAVSVPDPSIERYGSSKSRSSTHVVKSGETLGGIAKKYGVTVSSLMAANKMRKPVIFAGQTLVVRSPAKSGSSKKQIAAAKPKKGSKKKV